MAKVFIGLALAFSIAAFVLALWPVVTDAPWEKEETGLAGTSDGFGQVDFGQVDCGEINRHYGRTRYTSEYRQGTFESVTSHWTDRYSPISLAKIIVTLIEADCLE